MTNLEHLSTLIKSLTKHEKRYFRWSYPSQSGDKIYGDLYDLIEANNYPAEKIREKMKTAYPEAVLEPACKHLYKMLMRSLRNYESDKSIENKLMNLLGNTKILFNKGIFELCFSELERGKKLSLRHEKFGYYLLFARQELQYLTNLEFPGMNESALLEKQENINEYLNHELFINRHASLFELMTLRYHKQGGVRTDKEAKQLNDLLLEEFSLLSSKKQNSFESDKLHLHFQSTYFLMSGSPDQSLGIFKELNSLFQKNKPLWIDNPIYYIYLLHGILTNLHFIKEFDEMDYFLKELSELQPNGESILLFKDHLYYFHLLGFFMDQGKINEALKIAEEYEKMFANKIVAPNASSSIKFRLAVIYFLDNNHTKSLKLVNSVLNTSGKYISSELYILCRLLNLLIHLEMGNDDYLEYEIKSVGRKLKNEKKLFILEKITLQFFKKWLTLNNRTKVLKEFDKSLAELEQNEQEQQLLHLFPFRKWINSRLHKTTLYDKT